MLVALPRSRLGLDGLAWAAISRQLLLGKWRGPTAKLLWLSRKSSEMVSSFLLVLHGGRATAIINHKSETKHVETA